MLENIHAHHITFPTTSDETAESLPPRHLIFDCNNYSYMILTNPDSLKNKN